MEKEETIKMLDWIVEKFDLEFIKEKEGNLKRSWISLMNGKSYTPEEVFNTYLAQAHINYETITKEEIEEFVEVIDWSLVPFELITNDLVKQFSKDFVLLRTRLWFENILSKMTVRVEGKVSNFFENMKLLNEGITMIEIEDGQYLKCRNDILNVFEREFKMNLDEASYFIKNVFYVKFKIKIKTVNRFPDRTQDYVSFFNNHGILPYNNINDVLTNKRKN